jgi:hypothetical protein
MAINSTGGAADFGDLTAARQTLEATEDSK